MYGIRVLAYTCMQPTGHVTLVAEMSTANVYSFDISHTISLIFNPVRVCYLKKDRAECEPFCHFPCDYCLDNIAQYWNCIAAKIYHVMWTYEWKLYTSRNSYRDQLRKIHTKTH